MKRDNQEPKDELRSGYSRADFPKLVRGKYVKRVSASSNVVVVDPDVCDSFPNSDAVNAALRSLQEIARRTAPARRRQIETRGDSPR